MLINSSDVSGRSLVWPRKVFRDDQGDETESSTGFDTASSIALLAVSALAKRDAHGKGISSASIVILPVGPCSSIHRSGSQYTVPVYGWNDGGRFPRLSIDAVSTNIEVQGQLVNEMVQVLVCRVP